MNTALGLATIATLIFLMIGCNSPPGGRQANTRSETGLFNLFFLLVVIGIVMWGAVSIFG